MLTQGRRPTLAAILTCSSSCLAVWMVACVETEVPLERAEAGINIGNGSLLNGPVLNGRKANTGFANGRKANGIRLDGRRISSFTTSSGRLMSNLTTGEQVPVAAGDSIDVVFEGQNGGGATSGTIRVHSARRVVEGEVFDSEVGARTNEITYYSLEVSDSTGTYPYCPNGAEAVAVPGHWDPDSAAHSVDSPSDVTLACMGYAIGKCIEIGYWPWGHWVEDWDPVDGTIIKDVGWIHASCVRAIRADYCGSGESFTADGTLIDVSDRADFMTFNAARSEGWEPEAEWTADGASCVRSTRMHIPIPCQANYDSCANPGYDDRWRTSAALRTWARQW